MIRRLCATVQELPSDLKSFRADGERMKLAAVSTVSAALFMLAVSGFYAIGGDTLPEQINAAPQDYSGIRTGKPVDTPHVPAVAAPTRYGCLNLRNGQWLRLAIKHCPDGDPVYRWCRIDCVYGERDPGNVL